MVHSAVTFQRPDIFPYIILVILLLDKVVRLLSTFMVRVNYSGDYMTMCLFPLLLARIIVLWCFRIIEKILKIGG